MTKIVAVFVAATIALWAIVSYPASLLWGESAFLFSAAAAAICLIPTTITLAWSLRSFRSQPEQQVLAVLGGTGVRMAIVIAAGMALYLALPQFQFQRFWLWVIFFYLVTLALEVTLVIRNASPEQGKN